MRKQDAALIAGFLRGDAVAIATIDQWLDRAAWSYRRRLAGDWEDVLQDLRLELVRLLEQGEFQGRSSLSTFVWRVTMNRCLNMIRKSNQWQWTDLETVDREAGDLLRGHLAAVDRASRRDIIAKVLAGMSDGCKRLWLMVLEGLSYREMAERDERSEGALRVAVRRCRQRAIGLRDELLHDAGGRNVSSSQVTNPSERTKGGSDDL